MGEFPELRDMVKARFGDGNVKGHTLMVYGRVYIRTTSELRDMVKDRLGDGNVKGHTLMVYGQVSHQLRDMVKLQVVYSGYWI